MSVTPESVVHLTGAKETLLYPLYARTVDYRSPRPILGDGWAPEVFDRLDGYSRLRVRLLGHDHGLVLRARRLDIWTRAFLAKYPDATVLSLGSGLDSRAFRLDVPETTQWYDVDFPEVVELRERLYPRRQNHHLIGSSVTEAGWLAQVLVTGRPVLMIAEGLVMYLGGEHLRRLLARVSERFTYGEMIFDLLGMPQWMVRNRYDMWACRDPHELERENPRLTLLEDAPVLADHRLIPSPLFRSFYALVDAIPSMRTGIWPLRFRFER